MKRLIVGVVVVIASVFVVSLSVSPLLAQEIDYCEGNFDGDVDVDGTDASVFKSDFGRSQFSDPCPPNPTPVIKTGQTTSYATGDDGDLEKGVEWPNPRFTDNGDGTVTDNLTGLIWLKDANCFGTGTWNNALYDSNGLDDGDCGLTDGSSAGDWRLPNYRELFSLVDTVNCSPALPSGHPFINVQPSIYFSSTSSGCDTDYAWGVFMNVGAVGWASKINSNYVWPVRDPL